ncbi:MAG: YggS family pyridoxal phosphate-dependent enzyme [Pseudomonadota bacterium]
MTEAAERLEAVQSAAIRAAKTAGRESDAVTLIAISKTFGLEAIRPVIAAGHRVFGENRVQEAKGKWPGVKADYPDIELHLVGPLQSNKAKDAVALFDVIHTIDRKKIAEAIRTEMERQGRVLRLFVQVNTGDEPQKAGVAPSDADAFIAFCREDIGLKLEGLMCIPPVDDHPGPHFSLLNSIAQRNGLAGLSMGMSSDFEEAVMLGATHVRVGSAIFGARQAAVASQV